MADYRLAFAQWLREKENFHAAGYILDLLHNAKLSTPSNPNLPSLLANAYNKAADEDAQHLPEPHGSVELPVSTPSGATGTVIIWFGWSIVHRSILTIYSRETAVQHALTSSGVRPIFMKWGHEFQDIAYSFDKFKAEYAIKPVQKKGPPLIIILGVSATIALIAFILFVVVPNIPGL